MDINLADLLFASAPTCSKSSYMSWTVRIMLIWIIAAIADILGLGVDIAHGMRGFLAGTTAMFLLYPIARLGAARCRARGLPSFHHWFVLAPAIAIVIITLIATHAFASSPIPKLGFFFTGLVMVAQFLFTGLPTSIKNTASTAQGLLADNELPPMTKRSLPHEEAQDIPPFIPEDAESSIELPPPLPSEPAPEAPAQPEQFETLADADAPHEPMTTPPTYDSPYIPSPPSTTPAATGMDTSAVPVIPATHPDDIADADRNVAEPPFSTGTTDGEAGPALPENGDEPEPQPSPEPQPESRNGEEEPLPPPLPPSQA